MASVGTDWEEKEKDQGKREGRKEGKEKKTLRGDTELPEWYHSTRQDLGPKTTGTVPSGQFHELICCAIGNTCSSPRAILVVGHCYDRDHRHIEAEQT